VLALIAGLMMNVYYPNALVLTLLIPEALANYRKVIQQSNRASQKLFPLSAFISCFVRWCLCRCYQPLRLAILYTGDFLQLDMCPSRNGRGVRRGSLRCCFGQSWPVFLDATLVDRDGRTVSILLQAPDHWNFRHLRAARILLLHGLISGLGGHFILRK